MKAFLKILKSGNLWKIYKLSENISVIGISHILTELEHLKKWHLTCKNGFVPFALSPIVRLQALEQERRPQERPPTQPLPHQVKY